MLRFLPLLFPLALANCGAILASIELAERVDEAERLEALIATVDESSLAALPDEVVANRTGTVRYNGQAAMEVPIGNNTLILSAIAVIDADFDTDTVSADFSDWLGYNDGDTLANTARGEIVFSDGVIGDAESAANISGEVNGALTFKGDEFAVDGGMITGQIATFDGGEGIGGATVDEAVITMNGVEVPDAQFGFAGERRD